MAAIKRAHAGPGNAIDRNFVLFKDAKHADVRDAARESAAESQSYLGPHAFARVGERSQALHGFTEPFCGGSHPMPPHLTHTLANFARRGAFPVDRRWRFCNHVSCQRVKILMRRPIEKAAVLGAGTMGARIAAHLANAGIPCYLLDIVPPELNADEKRKGLTLENPAVRNRIVLAGLDAAKKSRPAAFFTPETARLITPGNFDDNLAWCGEADWIIEAVAENLEIKRKLLERVDAVRKPGTIVTSNTSGLPIRLIAEGRSEDFQQHWAGTHFFNPPRYMKLAELIPGPKTLPAVLEALEEICDVRLGKGVVMAKDTPNFIANRIGTFSMLNAIQQMQALEMTIEEVDACTGPAVGWPKSATFRTADIVGLDVLVHVIRNIYDTIPDDESREMFRVPPLVEEMMKRGWLGEKTGSGFYKRVKGAGGESEILTLDWQKMEYRPQQKARIPLDRGRESN